MRIFTITFCNTTNVGAALQEYALQKYLQMQKYDVKVVNYIPQFMAENHSALAGVIKSKNSSQFVKGLVLLPVKIKRKIKYWRFSKKYIVLTGICKKVGDIEKLEQPDIYIVGSDQVWNDELVNWDPGYFLQFKTTAQKIAYAASVGKDELSGEFLEDIKKRVQDFSKISVREESLKKAFDSIKMTSVKQVLDPVFLLSKEHYETILKKPKAEHYVLLYEAEVNEQCINVARKLSKSYGLKIVQINRINNKYRVEQLYPCVSPTEFLGLVKYADYIVTNSFHAVAMSLILEKQFWVVRLKERFSRLNSILKMAGIEDRIVSNTELDFTSNIDYGIVNENLRQKKKESTEFLKNAIDGGI